MRNFNANLMQLVPDRYRTGTELGVIHNIFLANLTILGNSCSCYHFKSRTDKIASYAIPCISQSRKYKDLFLVQ